MANNEQLLDVAGEIVTAVREQDGERIHQSAVRLPEAAATATPPEVQEALTTLAPVVAELPVWIGGHVAQQVGAVAYGAEDTSVILPTLVGRAAAALESAGRFAEVWTAAYGDVPDPGDPAQVESVVARLGEVAPGEAPDLVAAWFAAAWWLHPILLLAQRKDVRLAMPQRERLLAAARAREADIENASWLVGLLQVLDDEPLVVVHRPSGRGFRLTVGGVGDTYQLHVLLADRLIGAGLPGSRPSAEAVRAATDGEPGVGVPAEAQFAMVDGYGKAIAIEGRPADIDRFQGARLIVLEAPAACDGGFEVGRAYPMMVPELTVDGELSPAEAADLLA